MALYRFVSHEQADGTLLIGPEVEETPCPRCGAEASPQVCPGDGRYHHHGCVHTVDGGLDPICNACIQGVRDEWSAARVLHEVEQGS